MRRTPPVLLLVVVCSGAGLPAWVADLGIWTRPGLALGGSPRGLLAGAGGIPAEGVVARVPLAAMINVEHADRYLELPDWLPDWLCVGLLLHRLAGGLEARAGWRGYVDWLPAGPDSPALWSARELRWLDNSSVARPVRARQRQIRRLAARLAGEAGWLGRVPGRAVEWAAVTLSARLFRVQVQDRAGDWHVTHSLVPLADAMNTAAEPNTRCWTEMATREFVCEASRPVRPGQPLTAEYAGRTNDRLLLDYGFASQQFRRAGLERLELRAGRRVPKQQQPASRGARARARGRLRVRLGRLGPGVADGSARGRAAEELRATERAWIKATIRALHRGARGPARGYNKHDEL